MKRLAFALLGAILVGLAVPVLWGGFDLLPRLESIPPLAMAAALGLIAVSWCCNGSRLALLVGAAGRPLPFRQAIAVTIAAEFAICATPGGSGGPVAYTALLTRRGVSGAGALALYMFEQLSDLLFFATILPILTVLLALQPGWVTPASQIVLLAVLVTGALLSIGLALRHYRPFLKTSGRLLARLHVPAPLRRRLVRLILQFRAALGVLVRLPPPRLAAVFALCAVHWVARYSILYLLITALGGTLPWAYAFLAQMLALTAGHAVPLPGGSGGVELAMSTLLAPHLNPGTVAAAVIGWRFATYHWYLLAGAPFFVSLAGRDVWAQLSRTTKRRRRD